MQGLRSQPWADAPDHLLQPLVGVLTDIDDTLTTDGAITANALQALTHLKAAGFHVVAITGRPLGWSLPFARAWPLDAIVAENGAVALIPGSGGVQVEYAQSESVRQANAGRLSRVAERVLREVTGGTLAADSAGRATDIAIQRLFGRALDDKAERWVYVGDSTNDQAMFSDLPLTVGVANLLRFADALTVWPTYLTAAERGAGFAEVVERLLVRR